MARVRRSATELPKHRSGQTSQGDRYRCVWTPELKEWHVFSKEIDRFGFPYALISNNMAKRLKNTIIDVMRYHKLMS